VAWKYRRSNNLDASYIIIIKKYKNSKIRKECYRARILKNGIFIDILKVSDANIKNRTISTIHKHNTRREDQVFHSIRIDCSIRHATNLDICRYLTIQKNQAAYIDAR
jgi:hypothetical protein